MTLSESRENYLVRRVSGRLMGFTRRQMLRMYAAEHFGIPSDLTDEEMLRVFRRALEFVEGTM